MNEELFNEAARSNVLSKKLIDQLQESMTYSSISFINWTIEVLTLIKNRLERGDRISDEVSGKVYTIHSFQKFVKANFSSYITSQVFKEISNPEKIYYTLTPCEDGYSLLMADSGDNKTYAWISSISKRFSLVQLPVLSISRIPVPIPISRLSPATVNTAATIKKEESLSRSDHLPRIFPIP